MTEWFNGSIIVHNIILTVCSTVSYLSTIYIHNNLCPIICT